MHWVGHDLTATISEYVQDFQALHGPKSGGCTDDEQAAKKQYLADDQDGDVEQLSNCPIDVKHADAINEDDQALQHLAQAAQNKA